MHLSLFSYLFKGIVTKVNSLTISRARVQPVQPERFRAISLIQNANCANQVTIRMKKVRSSARHVRLATLQPLKALLIVLPVQWDTFHKKDQVTVPHVAQEPSLKQKVNHLVLLVILVQHQMKTCLAVQTAQLDCIQQTVRNVLNVHQALWL